MGRLWEHAYGQRSHTLINVQHRTMQVLLYMSTSGGVNWAECSRNYWRLLDWGKVSREGGSDVFVSNAVYCSSCFRSTPLHLLKPVSNQISSQILHARLTSLDDRRKRVYPLRWYQESSSMTPARSEYTAAGTDLAPPACVPLW